MSAPDKLWHVIDRKGKIHGIPDAHVKPIASVAPAYVEYTRSDLIPDIEAAAEARGREMGIRKARNAAVLSAWKHDGDDAFSKGMDAGARHQVKASIEAIAALLDADAPAQPKPDAVQVHGSDRNMVVALMNRYGLGAIQSGKLLATIDSLAEGDSHE